MHQALLPGKKFNKCTKGHDRFHSSLVDISNNRHCHNPLDPLFCFLHSFLIRTKFAHFAHVIFLFDIDGGSCFALHFLDHFTTRPDHSANKFPVNKHLDHPGRMWFDLASWLRHTTVHRVKNMQPPSSCLFQCLSHHIHWQTIYFDIHLHTADAVSCAGNFKIHV